MGLRGLKSQGFHSIPQALDSIRRGLAIVVVDDQDRENEGDVVFAASKSTPTKINFLAKHARGLICVALAPERAEALGLRPMTSNNLSRHETAFTVSVEAREGTTTGISAADRSLTARILADESQGPEALIEPGHTFPLKAKRGGVLVRAGHTEAAVDLVQMAGAGCAGVICEIMREDGTMARLRDCRRFAEKHKLRIVSVQDLIAYRRAEEKLVTEAGRFPMVTEQGEFEAHLFEDKVHGRRHLALVRGSLDPRKAIRVRVHSECVFGDVLGSQGCDCGRLLKEGMESIARTGGVFLYMRQAHPEEDFQRKAEAEAGWVLNEGVERQRHHAGTMDPRTYGIGAQILFGLGLRRLDLVTNHPKRISGLEGYGLKVVRQSPLSGESRSSEKSSASKKTKKPSATVKTGRISLAAKSRMGKKTLTKPLIASQGKRQKLRKESA
jgi:3,4-dihydroxy 2-butanone 4-phosphate synthase/GTP cyclohydrolase II